LAVDEDGDRWGVYYGCTLNGFPRPDDDADDKGCFEETGVMDKFIPEEEQSDKLDSITCTCSSELCNGAGSSYVAGLTLIASVVLANFL